MLPPDLMLEIKTAIGDKQDCADFLVAYGHYVELYDDFIDRDKEVITIHDVHAAATNLYSLPYWRANAHRLYALEKAIHCIFRTSVLWEDSSEEWKIRDAKALSHIGYAMLIGVLSLENPSSLNSIAPKLMEHCHKAHLGDIV